MGIPWLGWTCGKCEFCLTDRENLCERARFTGYTIDGGYAEYTVADARFCFPIPDAYDDVAAAPLLCAGLIGYRSSAQSRRRAAARDLRFWRGGAHHRAGGAASGARDFRVYPSGRHCGAGIRATTRREMGRRFRTKLPPETLDAAIIFAPVGALVPAALARAGHAAARSSAAAFT